MLPMHDVSRKHNESKILQKVNNRRCAGPGINFELKTVGVILEVMVCPHCIESHGMAKPIQMDK